MITVIFHVNIFVWQLRVSKILPQLTIVEGTCLDYNIHFGVICGEFVQTYEGIRNDMTPSSVDAIALGPNGNFQGGIRCFGMSNGRVLELQCQDMKTHKIPISAISRINVMCK